MIVSELFKNVNDSYRGTDDDAPTSGTDFAYWLRVANRKINEWATDTRNIWESLWEIRSITEIVAGTQSYALQTEPIALSDEIIVTDISGIDHAYRVIKAKERNRFTKAVYVVGNTLTFTDEIDDTLVGGTIKVPGYWLPDDLEDEESVVVVDNPYWLVYAVAADLAANDLTYASKEANLNGKANSLYLAMASANRRGTNNNPRITPTNVRRIRNV